MKVSYANMKLKTKNSVKIFDFCGQKIEVLKYLPAQDKYDLLMVTLQKSLEGNIYNDFKLDLFFELNLVYMYTNITFTEKQREDEFKLYDSLKSNGFFELFYNVLDETEYNELFGQLTLLREASEKSHMSIAGILGELTENLPKQAEAMADILQNFKPEQFKDVIDFARYINGNRDIETNRPIDNLGVPLIMQKENK